MKRARAEAKEAVQTSTEDKSAGGPHQTAGGPHQTCFHYQSEEPGSCCLLCLQVKGRSACELLREEPANCCLSVRKRNAKLFGLIRSKKREALHGRDQVTAVLASMDVSEVWGLPPSRQQQYGGSNSKA